MNDPNVATMQEFRRLSIYVKGGGLWLHTRVGLWLGLRFPAQCCLLAAVAAFAILLASWLDGSLILPGRNVGLLQHPGIWAFVCLQIFLPISVCSSLKHLLQARVNLRAVGALDLNSSRHLVKQLFEHLKLKDGESRALAAFLYSFGFAAFIWNTYQNQLPGMIVPFDFWDSVTYRWGFWITRIYKLYLFVFLLPYLAFLHISILRVGLSVIHCARIDGRLKLLPFHPDGVGGIGFLPEIITRPIFVGLLLTSLPMASAFYVHQAADVTPMIGLSGIVLAALVTYLIPILLLRADILAVKRSMVETLRWNQQAYFSQITGKQKLGVEALKSCKEAIETYDGLCRAIKTISNYPHLRRLIAIIVVGTSPTAISVMTRASGILSPIIRHWSGLP